MVVQLSTPVADSAQFGHQDVQWLAIPAPVACDKSMQNKTRDFSYASSCALGARIDPPSEEATSRCRLPQPRTAQGVVTLTIELFDDCESPERYIRFVSEPT
jgi:hypothetical protein